MKLSDFIDVITRAEACLEEQEQDLLIALLDSIEDLYKVRRETRAEQRFWNQFWYEWDFPKLRDARQQAFDDMAVDKYFHHIKENRVVYRNFEKAVAHDLICCRKEIIYELENGFSDLSVAIFYSLQFQVQQYFENKDFPPIGSKREMTHALNSAVEPKENSAQEEIAVAASTAQKETKLQKRNQLEQERKERDVKEPRETNKEKGTKWPGYCRLQILTPEGDFIETGNSNLTFLEFVLRVGYKKVRALGLTFEDEPIFGDTPKNGWWKEITKDVYLCCRMNCELKIEYINKICNALGVNYKPSMTKPIE